MRMYLIFSGKWLVFSSSDSAFRMLASSLPLLFFKKFKKFLTFIDLLDCTRSYLWRSGLSIFIAVCGVLSCSKGNFSCIMRDLVSWPEIKPGSPALGVQSLSLDHHEVPLAPFRADQAVWDYCPNSTSCVPENLLAYLTPFCLQYIWNLNLLLFSR